MAFGKAIGTADWIIRTAFVLAWLLLATSSEVAYFIIQSDVDSYGNSSIKVMTAAMILFRRHPLLP